MTKPRLVGPRKQRGYASLFAVMAAMALSAAALAQYMRWEQQQTRIRLAHADGEQLGQFAIGLRSFIASVQSNPGLLPTGQRAGVDWLKPPACGGAAGNPEQGYVPCAFSGGRFGPMYRTTFTRNATTNAIEARTTFLVGAQDGAQRGSILYANSLIESTRAQTTPSAGMFLTALANVPTTATVAGSAAADPGANAGRIVLIANNAPGNDIYLRTDGTNSMMANLNMGGMSIGNAQDARFAGDVRVDNRMQVQNGLSVTAGAGDFQAGLISSELAITSIGKFASEGIYDATVYTGAAQYTVAKQNCSQAGNNPGIYASIQSTGTPNDAGYTGDALYQSRVDVYDQGGSWRVVPVVETTRFDLRRDDTDLVLTRNVVAAAPNAMRILVMRRCR